MLEVKKYVYEISAINASEIIKYGESIKTCQFIVQNMCSTESILLLLVCEGGNAAT